MSVYTVCDTNPLDCWPLASGAIVALAATFPPGLGQDLVMVNSILDTLFYFFFVSVLLPCVYLGCLW